MPEKLFTPKIPPGMYANGTINQSMGRWYDGSGIRFRAGAIGPVGGCFNPTFTGAAIAGLPQTMLFVADDFGSSGALILATSTKLYAINMTTQVVFDITPAGIGAGPFSWQLAQFGSYVIANIAHTGTSNVNYFVWQGVYATPAALAAGNWADTGALHTASNQETPTGTNGVVVTPERFVMLLGGANPTSVYGTTSFIPQTYSGRRVFWASQEQYFDFRPAEVNTAGDFELPAEGVLVCGKAARGETLLWTTQDLWAATYIGGSFIYSFERRGQQCGIVNQNAAVVIDAGAYWMGRDCKFFHYNHAVSPIPCEVEDRLRRDLNTSLVQYIWALANPAFGEITWFFGDSAATTSDPCNRYVTYNYEEQHWTLGNVSSLNRVAGVTNILAAGENKPWMIDKNRVLWKHETGDANRGTVFLRSGPVKLGEGDNLVCLQRVVPDDKTLGDVAMAITAYLSPDDPGTGIGPFALSTWTPIRITGRQFQFYIVEAVATSWRVGNVQFGGVLQGLR